MVPVMGNLVLSHSWPAPLISTVTARYEEPHRHYHTVLHLEACLRAVHVLTQMPPREVELALLFHDAVYDPSAANNEQASVELLFEEGRRAWLDDALLQRTAPLILATKHLGDEMPEEAGWVVDADLSILGTEDQEKFELYEQQVRREYAFVDDHVFAAGRANFVRGMLERDTIFATRRGRLLWEKNARRNLRRSALLLPKPLPCGSLPRHGKPHRYV